MHIHKKSQIYSQLRNCVCGVVISGLVWLCFTGVVGAAVLNPQAIEGIVDMTQEGLQDWQTLSLEAVVEAGKIVRTDLGAMTNLQGEDGSLLTLEEITQLLVRELEFNKAQEIRIVRLAIIEGLVTADAAHFEYATNVFDIETPTVTASFKFSKAQIGVAPGGDSRVTMKTGKFDLSREGKPEGNVLANHQSQEGVVTALQLPKDGRVEVQTQEKGLTINNIGQKPLTISVGGQTISLPSNGAIATAIENKQLQVNNTGATNVSVGGQSVAPNESVGGLAVTTAGECCQQCGQQPSAGQLAKAACEAAPAECDKIKAAAIKAAPESAAEIQAVE